MKKNITGLFFLILTIALVGCGAKTETATYVLDEGSMPMKVIFTYQGDKVLTQTVETTMPYSSMGVTTKEEAETIFSQMNMGQYDGVDGLTYSIDYSDTAATQKISVDYDKVDYTKAVALLGTDVSGDATNGVSLKQSEEALVANGFKKAE